MKKWFVIEYEVDDEDVEVEYVSKEQYEDMLGDDFFLRNIKQLETIYEVKEERWLCQHPQAVGKKFGKEILIKE